MATTDAAHSELNGGAEADSAQDAPSAPSEAPTQNDSAPHEDETKCVLVAGSFQSPEARHVRNTCRSECEKLSFTFGHKSNSEPLKPHAGRGQSILIRLFEADVSRGLGGAPACWREHQAKANGLGFHAAFIVVTFPNTKVPKEILTWLKAEGERVHCYQDDDGSTGALSRFLQAQANKARRDAPQHVLATSVAARKAEEQGSRIFMAWLCSVFPSRHPETTATPEQVDESSFVTDQDLQDVIALARTAFNDVQVRQRTAVIVQSDATTEPNNLHRQLSIVDAMFSTLRSRMESHSAASSWEAGHVSSSDDESDNEDCVDHTNSSHEEKGQTQDDDANEKHCHGTAENMLAAKGLEVDDEAATEQPEGKPQGEDVLCADGEDRKNEGLPVPPDIDADEPADQDCHQLEACEEVESRAEKAVREFSPFE